LYSKFVFGGRKPLLTGIGIINGNAAWGKGKRSPEARLREKSLKDRVLEKVSEDQPENHVLRTYHSKRSALSTDHKNSKVAALLQDWRGFQTTRALPHK